MERDTIPSIAPTTGGTEPVLGALSRGFSPQPALNWQCGLEQGMCPPWHYLENEKFRLSPQIPSLTKILRVTGLLAWGWGGEPPSQSTESLQERSGQEEPGPFLSSSPNECTWRRDCLLP